MTDVYPRLVIETSHRRISGGSTEVSSKEISAAIRMRALWEPAVGVARMLLSICCDACLTASVALLMLQGPRISMCCRQWGTVSSGTSYPSHSVRLRWRKKCNTCKRCKQRIRVSRIPGHGLSSANTSASDGSSMMQTLIQAASRQFGRGQLEKK